MFSASFIRTRARLELCVLKPLWAISLGIGIWRLFLHDWFAGIFLLIMGFMVGAVGQALHPEKSIPQLMEGTFPTPKELKPSNIEGSILSHEESRILAKTMMGTAFLLAVEVGVLAIHLGVQWYFTLLLAFAMWPLVVVVFSAITLIGRRSE